jgi:hypothetical protein
MVVFPALAVMTAALSFNLLGDAWRDWRDPRTRAQMAAQGVFSLNCFSRVRGGIGA